MAILDLNVNGYLYRQNNLTNKFLDFKKEVLVEIFGHIIQYNFLICRLAAILKKRMVAELCPADQMSTLLIFIGDWSIYMN